MSPARVTLFVALALAAFAGNSLLCRAALARTSIDPATFTSVRLASGALALWLLVRLRDGAHRPSAGTWASAFALYAYAAAFSFAYVSLPAGTGALLLFGAVQVTMIGWGLRSGERLRPMQVAGFAVAIGGLVGLVSPGIASPPLRGALLMITAGVAWGAYSLRGRGAGDATRATAGNFARAVPFALAAGAVAIRHFSIDVPGVAYAVASGALTSGVGYAIWYAVLPSLRATTAATLQLAVPAIATASAIVLLDEPLTLRVVLASIAILGGIAVFLLGRPARR